MTASPLALMLLAAAAPPEARPSAEGIAFFESRVRPILFEHCQNCHGAKKQQGGLRLDTREGVLAGGDSGPLLVPGKPEKSLLIRAIRHTDADLKMPPKSPLSAAQIASLEEWVRLGAPDPRDGTQSSSPSPVAKHWAFQPVQKPAIPTVKTRDWVRTSVDAFVLAKLEANGLKPSPEADRRTLLRRIYFDLIGLPPTPEQVENFEKNPDPKAFEKVVDDLLASPRYGERWARHWLDIARYADTKDGVLMYGDDRVRPFAYTYRDYVIRAFNEDRPFDQFVLEQLAADRIPDSPSERLAAMGFLTLGRMFDGNSHDVIDDQIDVVTRGFLGLTVACARCHDHKYDPIPTADYYALYGVFANSETPLISPRLEPDTVGPKEFEAKYAAAEKGITEMLDQQYRLLSETARIRTPDYLLHVATTEPDPIETAIFFMSLSPGDLRPVITGRWRAYLAKRAVPTDPIFGPWARLRALPDHQFALTSRGVIAEISIDAKVNRHVRAALTAARLNSRAEVARVYGSLLKETYVSARVQVGPPDQDRFELLAVVAGQNSPAYFPKSQTRKYMSRGETDNFGGKLQNLDRLAVHEKNAPARAMCLQDLHTPSEPRIFVRGNPSRPGEMVARRNLSVLGSQPFGPGSGRLDLARTIVDPKNPLTARVFVNRVWMHHLGEPLVSSPSDFGVRTAAPVHQALLDHLAFDFVKQGWSIKKLHREIVLSSAYRQSSADREDARGKDPENRLLWRANRRRLDFESMRDAMLAVSGRLDDKLYGRPVEIANDASQRRRTVYGMVDRQSLPGVFRAFDFASPDASAERRNFTTVPQQALFAMNSPFVATQAKALAARPEVAAAPDPEAKVRTLHRLALQRNPTTDEIQLALNFVAAANKDATKSQLGPWEQWAQVLLLTNEFLFVD